MKTLLPIFLAASLPLCAHESPSHTIEHLTEHINEKPTASLYADRATEYHQIAKSKLAIADLNKAIALTPDDASLYTLLATILHETNQPALPTANKAVAKAKSNATATNALTLRARIHLTNKDYKKAQIDISLALDRRSDPPADWFLTQAEINLAIGDHQKRAIDLEAALKRNPNAALHIAWIESLIEAGQAQKALPIINKELNDSRLKSSWLYRRALAYRALGKYPKAKTDLLTSIELLNARIDPNSPNPILLTSKIKAEQLLASLQPLPTPKK